jgi:EAL domain-containing protein (putative c-di-GMP-specific phosphodiesterase class I)
VADIADDAGAAALADGIVRLARTLRLQTVAEGVETLEQARVLQAIGDVVAQGYLFARPLPAEELAAQLSAGECWRIAADTGQSAA